MGMTLRSMNEPKAVDTRIKSIETLPLAKHYLEELGLPGLFNKHVPGSAQSDMPPGQVLSVWTLDKIVCLFCRYPQAHAALHKAGP